MPDPPRQAKAHLISVIGGDTQISAISAAISLGTGSWWKGQVYSRFESVSLRNAQCFKGSVQLAGRKKPLRHLIASRKSSLPATCRRGQEEPCWLARKTDSSGPLSPIFTGSPECRTGLTGLLANWTRTRPLSERSGSDACNPVLVKGEKEQFLDWLSWGVESGAVHFPLETGSIRWPSLSLQDLFLPAS